MALLHIAFKGVPACVRCFAPPIPRFTPVNRVSVAFKRPSVAHVVLGTAPRAFAAYAWRRRTRGLKPIPSPLDGDADNRQNIAQDQKLDEEAPQWLKNHPQYRSQQSMREDMEANLRKFVEQNPKDAEALGLDRDLRVSATKGKTSRLEHVDEVPMPHQASDLFDLQMRRAIAEERRQRKSDAKQEQEEKEKASRQRRTPKGAPVDVSDPTSPTLKAQFKSANRMWNLRRRKDELQSKARWTEMDRFRHDRKLHYVELLMRVLTEELPTHYVSTLRRGGVDTGSIRICRVHATPKLTSFTAFFTVNDPQAESTLPFTAFRKDPSKYVPRPERAHKARCMRNFEAVQAFLDSMVGKVRFEWAAEINPKYTAELTFKFDPDAPTLDMEEKDNPESVRSLVRMALAGKALPSQGDASATDSVGAGKARRIPNPANPSETVEVFYPKVDPERRFGQNTRHAGPGNTSYSVGESHAAVEAGHRYPIVRKIADPNPRVTELTKMVRSTLRSKRYHDTSQPEPTVDSDVEIAIHPSLQW